LYFLAADLFRFLESEGCEFVGDEFTLGQGWVTKQGQTFAVPVPDEINGRNWFEVEVIEDNFTSRWLGFSCPLSITRYSLAQINAMGP
jgi:hypothetical protein